MTPSNKITSAHHWDFERFHPDCLLSVSAVPRYTFHCFPFNLQYNKIFHLIPSQTRSLFHFFSFNKTFLVKTIFKKISDKTLRNCYLFLDTNNHQQKRIRLLKLWARSYSFPQTTGDGLYHKTTNVSRLGEPLELKLPVPPEISSFAISIPLYKFEKHCLLHNANQALKNWAILVC